MSTGILHPFEQEAMDNMPLPDGLSLEDQSMYLALRNLYAAKRLGIITRDQGMAEKLKLKSEYDKRKRLANTARKQSDHTVSMWRDMEGLVSAYRKNRTLEIADKLADATQGKVVGWKKIGEGD